MKIVNILKNLKLQNCFFSIIIVISLVMPEISQPAEDMVLGDVTDSSACGFPIRAVAIGKPNQQIVITNGQQKKVILTGQSKLILTNVNTGFTTTLQASNPVTITFDAVQRSPIITLTGNILVKDFSTLLPLKIWHGRVVLLIAQGLITKYAASKQAIDACRLLDPSAPPVQPRTTLAPWGVPLTASGANDVLGGTKFAGLTVVTLFPIKHVHSHLDIFINGQTIPIPVNIGIPEQPLDPNLGNFYAAPIHTHDFDAPAGQGILHAEADEPPFDLTLGNFFDIWEVRLTSSCIGGHCVDANHPLRVYVNGTLFVGDPRKILLNEHAEIAIVYGAPPVSGIPSSFDFSALGY